MCVLQGEDGIRDPLWSRGVGDEDEGGIRIRIFFRAEGDIREVERSRGLGDVYKRLVMVTTRALGLFSSIYLLPLIHF